MGRKRPLSPTNARSAGVFFVHGVGQKSPFGGRFRSERPKTQQFQPLGRVSTPTFEKGCEILSEKTRFALWAGKDVLQLVRENYQKDNCKTQSEYIENAIRFYSGYLAAESADHYLPHVLASVLEGKLGTLGSRIGRLLFKLTVEESMLMHIIASDTDIDLPTLERLRVRCVQDAKRTNGEVSFADALKFQKEM